MRMLIVALALVGAPVAAAQHHDSASRATSSAAPHGGRLTEPGQSAFAAIAELVAALEADPNTDWSRVDVERLRQHLVDMDHATTGGSVAATSIAGGARFTVTGPAPVAQSLRRIVSDHARTMNGEDGWSYAARDVASGVEFEVTSPRPADAVRIRALGFAGILARGGHHQAHHEAIATGSGAH